MPGRRARNNDATASQPQLRIERATIRVSGVDPRDAGALGRDVARGLEAALARRPAARGARSLGALELRVTMPEGGERGVREAALAERIADAIARAVE